MVRLGETTAALVAFHLSTSSEGGTGQGMLTRRAETSKAQALFIAARSDRRKDGPIQFVR